jgi:hypothetical protein
MMQFDFARQLESQMRIWEAQVREYQAQMQSASTQMRSDYEKAVAEMQNNIDRAREMLEGARGANETAWNDLSSASLKAFEQLQKGWADALSRYKND